MIETTSFKGKGEKSPLSFDAILDIIRANKNAKFDAAAKNAQEEHGIEITTDRMRQSINLTNMVIDRLGYDPENMTPEQEKEVGQEIEGIIHYGEEESSYETAARAIVERWDPKGEFAKKRAKKKRGSE